MKEKRGSKNVDLDPVLVKLGARGRFQLLQIFAICSTNVTAASQLYNNVFLGMDVPYRCAEPPNNTELSQFGDFKSNWSDVRYEQCHIVLVYNVTGDVTEDRHDCVYGHDFARPKDASFMSDFDLVCDRYLLVSLSQTFLVLGQGIGAFVASIISDRYGRKLVLVGSQLGLLVIGVAIGASPSFYFFLIFKCVIGIFQQGVVTASTTMGIELLPIKQRSLSALIVTGTWALGVCLMAPVAFLLRHHSWRVLQYTLSVMAVPIFVLQFFYVEESLRWLVDNGKEQKVVRFLKRAARTNKKNLDDVLSTLGHCQAQRQDGVSLKTREHEPNMSSESDSWSGPDAASPMMEIKATTAVNEHDAEGGDNFHLEATSKLSLLDLFRHRRVMVNTLMLFFIWFTVSLVVFALYMMSTSYTGDPYVSFTLTAIMELPPVLLLFVGVDKIGRKRTLQCFFVVSGIGCIGSGICRIYEENSAVAVAASIFAMVGVCGGTGAFSQLFIYTPELYPTNLRHQALGTSSTVGRVGGMLAPFMKNLSMVVVWGPGVIASVLCTFVVFFIGYLPETNGRPLPTTIEDIEGWYSTKVTAEGGKGGEEELAV